ncbi:alpha/beta hydrolase [Microbacterium sp.]|uniref:alpha/beta hydrolase n=1 Tax=Microbacterium sp. TaxID=51671 RepID=UPI003A909DD8
MSDAEYWATRIGLSQPGLIDPEQDDGWERGRADIAHIEREGLPRDPRDDIDTASLRQRFPHLVGVTVEEIEFLSPHGALPAKVYQSPETTPTRDSGFVWIHGGGWIAGDLEGPEAHWISMELAARGLPVVSIEYHKAVHGRTGDVLSDDVLAGWLYARDRFAADGLAPDAIHLGGGSAGAALAAGLSLRLRDERRPLPASVVLIYPLVHANLPPLGVDILTAVADVPKEALLTPGQLDALIHQVRGDDGLGGRYVYAGDAEYLADQPPHLIVNAERDPLRASGELYGWQLARAGVPNTTECQSGILHGHLNHPGDPDAVATVDRILSWITDQRRPS